jgi:1,3-beta-glucanosyltransferase GAS1
VTVPNGTDAAPYVKAATRDMKSYMRSKGGRYIPMGYSAADISSIRPMFQDYLVCGPENDTIDFFAVNIYEWCGDSTYETSGYSDRIAELQGYPVPAFFSEDGCITVRPRTFTDMAAIFGPDMTPVLSGAFVYEWMQEANDYGIITYPDFTTQDGLNVSVGSPVPMQPEFGNLQSQWAAATPSSISEAAYTPTATTMVCPGTTVGTWDIVGNAALPDTPTEEDQNPEFSSAASGTLFSENVG